MSLGLYNGTITNNGQGLSNGLVNGSLNGALSNTNKVGMPTGNLLHYVDMSNRYCFPGGSATVAKDLAQLPTVNVTVSGAPTFDLSGGGCLSFNKTAQWITTPASTLGAANSNYTWGGWFNIREIDGVQSNFLLNRGKDTPSFGWSLIIGADSTGSFWIGSVTSIPSVVGQGFSSTLKAAPNTWYNVVGTHQNGVGLTIYVNGNFVSFFAVTGTNLRTSNNGWTWAANAEAAANYFNGRIAITYAYQRLLSPSEIRQLYNVHKSRFLKN